MNINQAKEQIQNAITAYLTKDEYGSYRIPIERQRPIFLMGPPGIGKTAIMEQIAAEAGAKVQCHGQHAVLQRREAAGVEREPSIRAQGGDPDRETLSYIKTRSGDPYFEDDQGMPWRCYNYIADALCYQTAEDPMRMYEAGKGFGRFLTQLDGYPVETLFDTIPNFHDTEKRLAAFKQALQRDVKDRARTCRSEIEFVLAREADCSVLMEQLRQGRLPIRVTHNDTKLNNILFDQEGHSLCLIDLDTIMPGLSLNDYGDAIRYGASTAAEDETDLDKVKLDMELFELYTRGYLEATRWVITEAEREYLV